MCIKEDNDIKASLMMITINAKQLIDDDD